MDIKEKLQEIFSTGLDTETATLEIYMLWCETVTITAREYQQVLANSKVCNWFTYELAKHELEYAILSNHYPDAILQDKMKLYANCLYKLFSRFPKSLLIKAKAREVQPKTTVVAGIKIEFSTYNQN
jgi:hypothetical protein